MKLLTRQQVIDVWLKQSPKLLNSLVCPRCRDILVFNDINGEQLLQCCNTSCDFKGMPKNEVEEGGA
jgi:hypothetical protein